MKTHVVKFKRRRKGATNYKKRLKILLSGKPRVVIRKSLKNIIIQLIEYNAVGDKVTLCAHSKELEKFGWKGNKGNLPGAYLTGLLFGKKAKKKGVADAVIDIGLNPSVKGSRIYAALKGVIDAGFKIPADEKIFPSDDRISSQHISKYASQLDKTGLEKQFNNYIKNNIDIAKLNDAFNDVKKKISEA